MGKIYFTVVGLRYYHGDEFLEKGMEVLLKKDTENEHDSEAIQVELPVVGKIGYVANSPHTVIGECFSAGRMYDKMKEEAIGKIVYVLDDGVVCELLCDKKEEKQIMGDLEGLDDEELIEALEDV